MQKGKPKISLINPGVILSKLESIFDCNPIETKTYLFNYRLSQYNPKIEFEMNILIGQ